MADKYALVGKSYRMISGGIVHPGAQATLDQFKDWLGKDRFELAKKSKRFEKVKVETVDTAKPEPKDDKGDEK